MRGSLTIDSLIKHAGSRQVRWVSGAGMLSYLPSRLGTDRATCGRAPRLCTIAIGLDRQVVCSAGCQGRGVDRRWHRASAEP